MLNGRLEQAVAAFSDGEDRPAAGALSLRLDGRRIVIEAADAKDPLLKSVWAEHGQSGDAVLVALRQVEGQAIARALADAKRRGREAAIAEQAAGESDATETQEETDDNE